MKRTSVKMITLGRSGPVVLPQGYVLHSVVVVGVTVYAIATTEVT